MIDYWKWIEAEEDCLKSNTLSRQERRQHEERLAQIHIFHRLACLTYDQMGTANVCLSLSWEKP